jgi:membrane protease YdiL (CAAX protease family)
MDLRTRLDRHPFAAYTALAYAISWTFWGLWTGLPGLGDLARTALFVAGGFGPFLAALVVLRATDHPIRPWLRRIFRARVRWTFYLVALALPVAGVIVAGTVHAGLFGGTIALDEIESPLAYPIFLAFVLLFAGGQEEPGWRGYLLPRLQESHSALTAAVAIGLVWAAWHLPLFVIPGTIQSDMSFALYVPNVVAISVILTWVTNGVGGSVVPAMVLHAGINAVANYYPAGGPDAIVTPTGYGLVTLVLILVAMALVWRYGPGELAPSERSQAARIGAD